MEIPIVFAVADDMIVGISVVFTFSQWSSLLVFEAELELNESMFPS